MDKIISEFKALYARYQALRTWYEDKHTAMTAEDASEFESLLFYIHGALKYVAEVLASVGYDQGFSGAGMSDIPTLATAMLWSLCSQSLALAKQYLEAAEIKARTVEAAVNDPNATPEDKRKAIEAANPPAIGVQSGAALGMGSGLGFGLALLLGYVLFIRK